MQRITKDLRGAVGDNRESRCRGHTEIERAEGKRRATIERADAVAIRITKDDKGGGTATIEIAEAKATVGVLRQGRVIRSQAPCVRKNRKILGYPCESPTGAPESPQTEDRESPRSEGYPREPTTEGDDTHSIQDRKGVV